MYISGVLPPSVRVYQRSSHRTGLREMLYYIYIVYRMIQKKKKNFWKTQQKLKKSKKIHLLTEIEPLQLAF